VKPELTERLYKEFPLLYADKTASIKESLMAFGFECQDGWFDIIYELSQQLELLIQQDIDENPDLYCRVCGCDRHKHYAHLTSKPGKCLAIHQDASKDIDPQVLYKSLYSCWCEGYQPNHPRAVQVKEKYGTLRFYMNYSINEMEDLIQIAEDKSAVTCEVCGEPGELRNHGWLFTFCDRHDQMRADGTMIYNMEK